MGRRAAQLWKNQEDLTNLGIVNDRLTMDDQLRVRIALRMMRKAHTKTLRSEADKYVILCLENLQHFTPLTH